MKLSTTLSWLALSVTAIEAATSQTCSTRYVSTSTKVTRSTVSRTTTSTVTVTSPSYVTATVVLPASTTTTTDFVYYNTTYWYTKAKTTITVPTPKGFTPMVSATTISGVRPGKREPGAVARVTTTTTTTSYPYQVACTNYDVVTSTSTYAPIYEVSTTTSTELPRTTTSTRTYTTWRAQTTTVSVATRTLHAACGPSNVIDTFNFRSINIWDTDGSKSNIGGGFSEDTYPDYALKRAAAQSPQDCCEAMMALGFSGFQYYGSTGYSATCVVSEDADHANFFVGPYNSEGHIWCGNGPGGYPTFAGFYYSANGFSP